jgi:hypothetical protein
VFGDVTEKVVKDWKIRIMEEHQKLCLLLFNVRGIKLKKTTETQKNLTKEVTFLTFNQRAPGSNIGRDSVCPEIFLCISSVTMDKSRG